MPQRVLLGLRSSSRRTHRDPQPIRVPLPLQTLRPNLLGHRRHRPLPDAQAVRVGGGHRNLASIRLPAAGHRCGLRPRRTRSSSLARTGKPVRPRLLLPEGLVVGQAIKGYTRRRVRGVVQRVMRGTGYIIGGRALVQRFLGGPGGRERGHTPDIPRREEVRVPW